jgi:hypothetical protein
MSIFENSVVANAYSRIHKDENPQQQQFSLEELTSQSSFKKKVAYCRRFLPHLGTGSARIVFALPNGHALKLAYNSKGLAQNRAESGDSYKEQFDCFTKTFNHENDFMWTETEIAVKCKRGDFKTLLGVTFEQMKDMLVTIVRMRGRGNEFPGYILSERYEVVKERLQKELDREYDSFFYQMDEFIGNYGIHETIADAFRLCNWGIVTRKGERWLVIVDSGLNEEVYDNYYGYNARLRNRA